MDIRYLPLLQNAREITTDGYDPKEKIQAFWQKYSVDHSRLHILNMFLFYKGETELKEKLSIEEMEQFSGDLMALLMAYYVVHHEKINLDDIKIPIEETRERGEEESFFSKIHYTILGLRHFEQKINQ